MEEKKRIEVERRTYPKLSPDEQSALAADLTVNLADKYLAKEGTPVVNAPAFIELFERVRKALTDEGLM